MYVRGGRGYIRAGIRVSSAADRRRSCRRRRSDARQHGSPAIGYFRRFRMQQIESAEEQDFVVSFALQRQRLLHHVSGLLGQPAAPTDSPVITQLSQTLMAALELLRVAEQELNDDRRTTATTGAAQRKHLLHLQALFDLA